MFNLETFIAEWRRQMRAAGINSPVPLDELESHLREDIGQRIHSGATPEQAFALAVKQIGSGEKLKAEFSKVEDTKRMRAKENLRRWSIVIGTAFVYLVLSSAWYLGVRSGKLEITGVEVVLAAGAMAPMILLGWAGRSLAKTLPVISENWIIVIALATLFAGAALFRVCFPVISPTNLVHLQIVTLWLLSPMLGFGNCVSAWFDRCAAIRKNSSQYV
ncbi:MAG TPA: permease prefix domain 1-containing protein [Verrucomicrobiae bacterium]|nr:permease prefix domain 1-containing protein [Verrucomicrobiae bacterium]